MSLWSRLSNVFRGDRISRELDEEMQFHIEEAIAHGRNPEEARRSFGSAIRLREQSRDIKVSMWLDSLRADVVFGWRQLKKHRTASAASVLSLALAMGGALAAFRLVDAVLLRRLQVAEPERLYYVATTFVNREGRADYRDDFDYSTYKRYRELIGDRGETMVIGFVNRRQDVRYSGSDGTERVHREYVSGNMFPSFGLKPALGRLFGPEDDVTPGGHPIAVLSYDYWTRRFGRDPAVIGQTFLMGKSRIEIVGVAPRGFTGTEPGEMVEMFVPAVMNAEALESPGWSWFRMWVRIKPTVTAEEVRQSLEAVYLRALQEELKGFASDTPREAIDRHLSQRLVLLSAAAGASNFRNDYQRPLLILGLLVVLVLMIACANVANIMNTQAAARSREMALRVSIGAGRGRVIQLVLTECAIVAALATLLGTLFAEWSAPVVVSMLRVPEDPVLLVLESGWRQFAFSFALALVVTLLFGFSAAYRASGVQPADVLKGGDQARSSRRSMRFLLSAQVAFCVTVLFVAGLFVATFRQLSTRPLGFSPENVLTVDTDSASELPPHAWSDAADALRRVPGVRSAAIAGWPLLSGNRWTGSVRQPGKAVEPRGPYMLEVSPNYFQTMGMSLIAGRDLRRGDRQPDLKNPIAGVGVVNESFARVFFDGKSPIGATVDLLRSKDKTVSMEIVGVVRDAVYSDLREPMRPVIYLPMTSRKHSSLLIRTEGDPQSIAPVVRREILAVNSGMRVIQIQPHSNFIRWRLVRERLLAMLSAYFAVVALLLSAIGVYGVLNYSVIRQRREIGIRLALGARAGHVVRNVTRDSAITVCVGCVIGLFAGVAAGRLTEALLYGVKATGLGSMAFPVLTLLTVAVLASLAPALRAVRVDPAQTLRDE